MRSFALASVTILVCGTVCGVGRAVEPPRLRELRTQTVNGVTYFQARFDRPTDLWLPNVNMIGDRQRNDLAQEPRLVPQDDQTRDVAFAPDLAPADRPTPHVAPAMALEFVGRRTGNGQARFLLLYATVVQGKDNRITPVEVPVEINFGQVRAVAIPPEAARRQPDKPIVADDLEGLWAIAQAHRFAVLEALSRDFGFFSFAQSAIRRHYHVSSDDLNRVGARREVYRQLYETTTGAAAITESLQLERMLGQRRSEGPRTIDLAKVPGIDIAEHPWAKMIAGRQPDAEPLAKLVPHDNYYLHFKSFAKFIEMSDLFDQWGTTAVRAYEVQATDYRLKERYEKQLCLKTTLLGRTLGPLVIKSLALTGSDAYLREGSDVAVIFHVANATLFRAGVEPFVRDARQEFGDQLHTATENYDGVAIESFVTPRREVSLYRASFGEYMVYANSLAGLHRILDARAGRLKPLADSLDFQYMRIVFKQTDPAEDGFLFLSDAFIRQLVGPASKIKEKRRLEGLAGLHMVTNAALYHGWQYGKPPADFEALLLAGDLKTDDLTTPDQSGVVWDVAKQQACSARYNTIHFATPLAELPIDKVTTEEAEDYARFRTDYLNLWRQYFDPVGMRLKSDGEQVRVETYILPLIRSAEYSELRRLAGDGTTSLDASPPTAKTVAQLMTHLSPTAQVREQLGMGLGTLGLGRGVQWLGDWAMIRFDDSPAYARLLALDERDKGNVIHVDEWIDAVFHIPVTLGVQVRNPLVFAGVLTSLRNSLMTALPGAATWEPLEPAYKAVSIVRIQATPQGLGMTGANRAGKNDPFLPAAYYALVDGAWYISLQEQPIRDMIDRAEANRKQPAASAPAAKQVNSAMFVSPEAASATKKFASAYLERETRQRSLANAPIWYAFAKAGLLDGQADESARQAILYRCLGYVPVSPEGAAYRFDPRADEVTNIRHGSPRRPTPQSSVDADSPLGKLLEQFRNISVELNFREDGIQTALTFRKK